MYFEMLKNDEILRTQNRYYRRILTWFLFHFVYFAALIVMLQGNVQCAPIISKLT